MLAKFRSIGHKTVEIEGGRNAQGEVVEKGLKEYAWDYIKSDSAAALERNRRRLAEIINKPKYVNNVWREKEEKVIY